MKHFSYTPTGVCASNITFDIKDGNIYNLKFMGGCAGNLQALSKLVEGKSALSIIELLKGNDCRGKGTSCADQLTIALEQAIKED